MRCLVARAIRAGDELCATAQEDFARAVAAAAACDAERSAGTLRGPLHGLPVSVKESIKEAGFDATCGLAARCGQPADADAVLVKVLRAAGAIPFVRTNVPQLLLMPESDNAIWGCALNPYDASRSPGGSSGGEAALIAVGGSALGVGTDVAGSIRVRRAARAARPSPPARAAMTTRSWSSSPKRLPCGAAAGWRAARPSQRAPSQPRAAAVFPRRLTDRASLAEPGDALRHLRLQADRRPAVDQRLRRPAPPRAQRPDCDPLEPGAARALRRRP